MVSLIKHQLSGSWIFSVDNQDMNPMLGKKFEVCEVMAYFYKLAMTVNSMNGTTCPENNVMLRIRTRQSLPRSFPPQ
jgi:hypothetical protein